MALVIAKIVVPPLLVALASLVMRLWGGLVAGMLVGFPMVTGPVAFFMALEQGDAYGRESAIGIILALAGVTSYCIVYGALAQHGRWATCQLAAVAAYFAVSALAVQFPVGLAAAAMIELTLVAVALAILPRPQGPVLAPAPPWWDLWVRMAVTVAIVLAVTWIAGRLGPRLSAIPASYPAITSVVVPFAHALAGTAVSLTILRGVLLSHISFTLLFIVVAALIGVVGAGLAYAIAVSAALITSAAIVWLDRWMRRPTA